MILCSCCGHTVMTTFDPRSKSHDIHGLSRQFVDVSKLHFYKSNAHVTLNAHVRAELGTAFVCKKQVRGHYVALLPTETYMCDLTRTPLSVPRYLPLDVHSWNDKEVLWLLCREFAKVIGHWFMHLLLQTIESHMAEVAGMFFLTYSAWCMPCTTWILGTENIFLHWTRDSKFSRRNSLSQHHRKHLTQKLLAEIYKEQI